jgi:hypothetical protein
MVSTASHGLSKNTISPGGTAGHDPAEKHSGMDLVGDPEPLADGGQPLLDPLRDASRRVAEPIFRYLATFVMTGI